MKAFKKKICIVGAEGSCKMKIAVAGTGYVGLSIATLLSQHHEVMAVDIIPEKVHLINRRKSPIQDEYIEEYLTEKQLNLGCYAGCGSSLYRCRFRSHRGSD